MVSPLYNLLHLEAVIDQRSEICFQGVPFPNSITTIKITNDYADARIIFDHNPESLFYFGYGFSMVFPTTYSIVVEKYGGPHSRPLGSIFDVMDCNIKYYPFEFFIKDEPYDSGSESDESQ
ncbi:unnamed protein product [Ambrosiozyma monospora]|uniref:Unnamed protein product n=1 Tax=Ambrosiozyma monospora TaxID=43982 RepID=A0ACB5SSX0_AMBMO|nr:unnamed protein product [Ambrosiozyma monospora]